MKEWSNNATCRGANVNILILTTPLIVVWLNDGYIPFEAFYHFMLYSATA